MPFVECCVTCGCVLRPEDDKRRKRPSVLLRACRELWRESPLVWAMVTGVAGNTCERETIPMCMPCVHWMNRVARRRGGRREPLLLDSFLAFLRLPCSVPAPDSRLVKRLRAALTSSVCVGGEWFANPYSRLVPPHLGRALEEPSGYHEFLARVTHRQWLHFGRGLLVGTRDEMRRLRRAVAGDAEASVEEAAPSA